MKNDPKAPTKTDTKKASIFLFFRAEMWVSDGYFVSSPIPKPFGLFHLAVVIPSRSDGFELFINGDFKAVGIEVLTAHSLFTGVSRGISIGMNQHGLGHSSVVLDELAIWTTDLDKEDVFELYLSYA